MLFLSVLVGVAVTMLLIATEIDGFRLISMEAIDMLNVERFGDNASSESLVVSYRVSLQLLFDRGCSSPSKQGPRRGVG